MIHDITKICHIIGTADTAFKIDYNDQNTEYWITGSALSHGDVHKADFVFEIHDRENLKGLINKHDFNRYENAKIFVQDGCEDLIRNSVIFNVKSLYRYFNTKYFTSSISFMIAYAIMKGFKKIKLSRIQVACKAEYGDQKPCLEYWIGKAEGLGIEVEISKDSFLLYTSHVYGFEKPPVNSEKIESRSQYHENEYKKATEKKEMLLSKMQKHQGALETLNFLLGKGINEQIIRNEIDNNVKKVQEIMKEYTDNEAILNQFMGAQGNNEFWEAMLK